MTQPNYENRYREAVRVIQQVEFVARDLKRAVEIEDLILVLRQAQGIIVDCAAFLDCHGEAHLT